MVETGKDDTSTKLHDTADDNFGSLNFRRVYDCAKSNLPVDQEIEPNTYEVESTVVSYNHDGSSGSSLVERDLHVLERLDIESDKCDKPKTEKEYYALRRGRFTSNCVYFRLEDVLHQVDSGNVQHEYRVFSTLSDAAKYIQEGDYFVSSLTPDRINHGQLDNIHLGSTTVPTALQIHRTAVIVSEKKRKIDSQSKVHHFIVNNEQVSTPSVPVYAIDQEWDSMYNSLDQFKKENGHTSATQGSKLGNWIQYQKQEYSNKLTGGKAILTSEQIRVLRALDTFFEIPCNRNFEDNIHDLQFFKDQNKGKDPNHFTMLGNWMDTIRHLYADTKSNTEAVVLSSTDQTHVDQLNKIGFDWKISNGADGTAKSFKRMYAEGKQSSSCNGNHSSNSQSKSTISKMQLKKEQKWNDKLQEMLVHKEEHGNTYPQKNSSLGRWALQQRHAYKLFKDENSNSTLITNENITKLLGIGFDFELHKNKYVKEETEWDGMYEELRVFQEKNGHAVPPTKYVNIPCNENTSLMHIAFTYLFLLLVLDIISFSFVSHHPRWMSNLLRQVL